MHLCRRPLWHVQSRAARCTRIHLDCRRNRFGACLEHFADDGRPSGPATGGLFLWQSRLGEHNLPGGSGQPGTAHEPQSGSRVGTAAGRVVGRNRLRGQQDPGSALAIRSRRPAGLYLRAHSHDRRCRKSADGSRGSSEEHSHRELRNGVNGGGLDVDELYARNLFIALVGSLLLLALLFALMQAL